MPAAALPGQRGTAVSLAVPASARMHSAAGHPPGAAAGGWPCATCGHIVPIDLDACESCGASFLARLQGDSGRHRSGSGALSRLPRPARLVVGLIIGVLLALLVPVLLALLG